MAAAMAHRLGHWMNSWFAKNLGDAMLAGEALDYIKALFLSQYAKSDRAEELGLFVRHESEGRLHCEVKVYFSPASAVVAKAVGAAPCTKPSSDGLDLLAGSELSWSRLFPGSGD
ncbi:MAG: hypothetical protein PVJ72_17795 [Gammaproteobacteria bacterium]|jgi:hypothetical protein